MVAEPLDQHTAVSGDAADHITEARHRAREVFSGEAHLSDVDDWRRTFVSARDALTLLWITWVGLHGLGDPPYTVNLLVALAVAMALWRGISTGRATLTKIQYYATELDRERSEIQHHFEHEKEEVRALYAAKGFRPPLLDQIVDTLAADDDRLLKVMMEEELGLSMHHMSHPLAVGLWNFAGPLAAGLGLVLPLLWIPPDAAHTWVPVGGAVLMALISGIAARISGRSFIEFFAVGVITAVVTGGVAYYLAQWLAGVTPPLSA